MDFNKFEVCELTKEELENIYGGNLTTSVWYYLGVWIRSVGDVNLETTTKLP